VAGAVLEMPLSGFLVEPGFVPTDGIAGPRHIYFEDGQWRLGSSGDLVAGNVDWKGEYVNGTPTLVLTWPGRSGRYTGAGGGSEGSQIFHNGRLFAVAPCLVRGQRLREIRKASAGSLPCVILTQLMLSTVVRSSEASHVPSTTP